MRPRPCYLFRLYTSSDLRFAPQADGSGVPLWVLPAVRAIHSVVALDGRRMVSFVKRPPRDDTADDSPDTEAVQFGGPTPEIASMPALTSILSYARSQQPECSRSSPRVQQACARALARPYSPEPNADMDGGTAVALSEPALDGATMMPEGSLAVGDTMTAIDPNVASLRPAIEVDVPLPRPTSAPALSPHVLSSPRDAALAGDLAKPSIRELGPTRNGPRVSTLGALPPRPPSTPRGRFET